MVPRIIFWASLLLILYTYFGYPLVLRILVWLRPARRSTRKRKTPPPTVTLLIPAYNEESVIEQKIKNSLNLDYEHPRMEIVVASDGAEDRTNEIVGRLSTNGLKLLSYVKREGKVNVLNKSIPRIPSEIVVLSDANTMYRKDAIKKLVRHFSSPDVGCVCGELKLVNPDKDADGDCERVYWNYERTLKRMEGTVGAVLGANGAIYAIRKHLFEPLPCDTIIDDFVLSMKIRAKGYRIVYEPEAVGVEETQSLRDEFRRRMRIGIGNFQSIKLLRHFLNPRRGLTSFSFWSHKILRWMVPFLLIGVGASNIMLVGAPFYKFALIFQACFYSVALAGTSNKVRTLRCRLVDFVHYFVALNIALLCGFLKFVSGEVSPIWAPTTRNSNNHCEVETIEG